MGDCKISDDPSKDYRKEIARKITTWLGEEKYDFELVADDNAVSNILIKLGDFNINLIVRKDRYDSLLIGSSIGLSPNDQRMFAYLKPDKQREFLRNCEECLLHDNIGYSFEPSRNNAEKIKVSLILFRDGLLKQTFFDGLLTVARTLGRVNLEYEKLRNPT